MHRSERWATNERIRRLEAILAQQPPRTARSFRAMLGRSVLLLATTSVLVAMTTFLGSAVYAKTQRPVRDSQLPPPPAPPAPAVRGGLGWYERGAPAHVGPWTIDVGPPRGASNEGSKLLIGLARDRMNDDGGLYAVAIDRATLQTRWRAGPYPSAFTEMNEGHFVIVKDGRVVVTDAGGGVHVLDARTGAEVASHVLRRAVTSACIDDETSAIALTVDERVEPSRAHSSKKVRASDGERVQTVSYRLGARHLVRAASVPKCADTYCSKHQPDACKIRDDRSTTPPTARVAASTDGIWREGSVRVATGKIDAMRAAAGWDTMTGALRWESMLAKDVLPELHDAPLSRHAALLGGRFVALYATETGALRLVSLDASTGARRFDVAMPKGGLGSTVRSLTLDGDDVFVAIDDTLHVLDARTGATRKTLESL